MPRLTAIHIAACLALAHVSAASAGGSDQVSAARHQAGPSTSRACLPAALNGILASIESRYGAVRVISTHRPGARIAGTNHASLHASCRAVDFHPAAGKYREVLAYLRDHWDGGIGTYSGLNHHLHLDVGSKKIWHTHVGSPGTAAGDRPAPRKSAARRQRSTNGYQAGEAPIY